MSPKSFSQSILSLPRLSKRLLAIVFDSALCALTVWIAFYLRLGFFVSLAGRPSIAVGLSILLVLPIFYATGLYRSAFRRIGMESIPAIAGACLIYGLAFAAIVSAYAVDDIPRTVGIIQPILLFIAVSAMRLSAGYLLTVTLTRPVAVAKRKRVFIYGAGSSGRQLAAALRASGDFEIVGLLDDDRSLHGTRVDGITVYPANNLGALIEKRKATEVLLAMPSASRRRRNEIIEELRLFPVAVKTLPGLLDLADGRVDANDLRDLTIEDLLARDVVAHSPEAVQMKLEDRTILVTGAGGSIGSELCRTIAEAKPRHLLLLENSEFALYAAHRQLAEIPGLSIVPMLGSVANENRVRAILEAWKPDMIFHAAAYKHVPLVEHNPLEGLYNNVIGTARIAQLAIETGVRDFVLISTDKAVRPTNVMGATKRFAELVLQGLAQAQESVRFSMVRFGNVLGSSGSVVPLFREQIRKGGPITITHPEVTRYFMTIPEAALLVVQASAMAQGGEVFVLDMGDPVRIRDLAERMIGLSGLTVRSQSEPHGDIAIEVVGLRPGEKLYEELLIGDDPKATTHPRIMMAREHSLPWDTVAANLEKLQRHIDEADVVSARELLMESVREYSAEEEIVDWVMLRNSGDVPPPMTARPLANS